MTECGPICCSIIVGRFGLGCSPITTKFDINIGCGPIVIPPTPPANGGSGGGGSVTHGGFYVPLTQKLKQTNRTVLISIKFTPDISWRKLVAVDMAAPTISVNINNITSGLYTPVVEINGVASTTISVSTSFNT
jgi:hypothetical protein